MPSGETQGASLADEHKSATRARIIRAAQELLADQHPAALSMAEIARRSGVGRATIYRHFEDKEALLDAIALSGDEQSREWYGDRTMSAATLREMLPRVWGELASNMPALIARNGTPAGRELRRRGTKRRRTEVDQGLRAAGVDPTTADGARMARALLVLTSSSALLELIDTQGLTVDEAVAQTLWSVDRMIETAPKTARTSSRARASATRKPKRPRSSSE